MNLKISIIQYPGSNCDVDMFNYLSTENTCSYIWHKETEWRDMDLLIIPGGFAFGDRLYNKATEDYVISPGDMAIKSPVTEIIMGAYSRNVPILGICNGFQILVKMGLLPGKLLLNKNSQFTCKKVRCKILRYFTGNREDVYEDLYIANSYGRYCPSKSEYNEIIKNKQLIILYSDTDNNDKIEEHIGTIGGVCSKNRRVFGMMPHPERTNSQLIKDTIYNICNPRVFSKRINELMSSEHISYKSTRKYLRRLYTRGKHVIQGPGENAGIIDIGSGYCIAMRMESHNHPIFIDPYQGAMTGVGGILRDIFAMGARPIALLDFLRFGIDKYNDDLLQKSIKGISDYGNCIGVPNVGGDLYRSSLYDKNPLLNVACIGIVKKDKIIYGNALYEDSILIYIGGKTGSDGVGGACMASAQFSGDTNVEDLKDNIQKGDPYLEKLLMEACVEMTDLSIIEGMQDMGAGGVLCASLELVKRGQEKTGNNLGCKIFVDKIPIKDYGEMTEQIMDPCTRLISESQERMLLVIERNNASKVDTILNKWDLESEIIGTIDMSGKYNVLDGGRMIYSEDIGNFVDITQDWVEKNVKIDNADIQRVVKIRDRSLWTQYDSTIGCRTLKGPLDKGSYSILDIYEIGKKLVITWGTEVSECYKKQLTLESTPKAVINCLNFGHPRDTMGDFSDVINDMRDTCEKYNIPVIGGNVSLYNSTSNVSIPPTPIIVMVGLKD